MLPAAALHSVSTVREIENRATAQLGDGFELMRRAGRDGWRAVLQHWPAAQSVLVVCGPGNNGGDGYVLAKLAHESGRRVRVVRLPDHAPRTEPAGRACADYLAGGGEVVDFTSSGLPHAEVLVDALFGIGLARAPDTAAAGLVAAINGHPAPVLALDVPSGVDAVTGGVPGVAVIADATLEFIAAKAGLRTGSARDCTGELQVTDLELAFDQRLWAGITPSAEWLRAADLTRWLPPRLRDSHKGRNGRVLCVGGEHGHGGAIMLAAEAALRTGAGLVHVVTRAAHVGALLARLPEAMAHGHADDADSLEASLVSMADVIAIGPGLGQSAWALALLEQAMGSGKPAVLDADALNLMAKHALAPPPGSVLTPHPGEAARLLEVESADIQRDRFAAAQVLAVRHDAVVVLKGAGTVIAAPGRTPRLVDAGNPGMAVGGMGDVLTGVIAALRGQGLDAFDAASCGALLHAVAGDAAASDGGERGLLPSDLMPRLRRHANPAAVR
ncbi:MAG TPA: NAD(P)H-hydrate dehydratase [Lysobacter sp.]|nr:NAD(P)H-hydrate dehydratase [Lysobacter sp.]